MQASSAAGEAGRTLSTGIMERPDPSRRGGPYEDTGNTDVVFHAGQLLASWWMSGKAHVIRSAELETIGVQTYDRKLQRRISAHPKIGPRTGERVFFDCSPLPPYLPYGVVDARGRLVHQEPIERPAPRGSHWLPHVLGASVRAGRATRPVSRR